MVRTSQTRLLSLLVQAIPLATFLFVATQGVARTTDPPPESARFRHFTVEHGLSQNTVRAILQDRHGFLWAATEEGLNRYDGYSFKVYRHDAADASSLPSDIVTALYEDRKGRFWVGARGGVCRFDPRTETFSRRVSTHEEVMAFLEDRQGRLWIGTAGDGLFRLDNDETTPVRYRHSEDAGSLAHDMVYALLEDRGGRLWVGTHGGGLDLFDPETDRFTHHRHDENNPATVGHDEIWSLAEDPAGRIWVATNGAGVSVLNASRKVFHHYRHQPGSPKSLEGKVIPVLYVDRRGALWIGTDIGGLHRYVAENDSFVAYRHIEQNAESLSPNAVRAIYEDGQGNLWVSTLSNGLNWLRRNVHPFELYTHQPGDPSSLTGRGVAAFLQDAEGSVWVGAQGWLNRFDPRQRRFSAYSAGDAAVLDIHQDRRGRIWVGTWGDGLLRFDPSRGAFVRYPNPADDDTTGGDEQVWAIEEDERGALWLATDNGVFRFDPETRQAIAYRQLPAGHPDAATRGLASSRTRELHRDSQGNLWIFTFGGGLNRLAADGRITHYRHDPANPRSISNDWPISFHRDRLGRLWIGTFGGGLNLFEPADESFTAYGEAEGLPSKAVYSILEDDHGRLWLGTNNALCRFDPKTKRAETFDTTNGLQNVQFNLGAALRTHDGTMLFGTNGFYAFDPNRITPNPHVPPIVLTTLEVLNEPRKTDVALPQAEEIRLHYDEKIISFEFAVLDYTFPRRNNYMYKLEGFNDDWVDIKTKRDVTFTNLDPGKYVLHIKGSNSDGVWDNKGRSLRIVIPPPYWKTWWFQASGIFAGLGLIFSAHRYRLRRHEEHEKELELRVDDAMSKLKVLKGLLPICATCKKVRDDKGYWNQIESYIRSHSEADFSHGICPDCIVKYWGNTRAAATLKKRES